MKVYAIGGYSEVGKNMTAVDLGEDAFIFDCGLFLPPIVELEESERIYTEKRLRQIEAVPNDLILDDMKVKDKVRAVVLSHAHLDHVGAIPFLGHRYDVDIIGTPYTIEVLKTLLDEEQAHLKNKFKIVQPNSFCYVQGKSKKYMIEFINITHSTLQTAMVALHTDEGVVLYCNDFKFDNNPIVGKMPNYERLEQLGNAKVKVAIVDCLYSGDERKTASEKVARTLLEEVMLTINNKNSGIFVTTFSSHIARLKSITDFGKQLNRKILFLGRSLAKYTLSASKIDLCPFIKDVEIATYKKQLERCLRNVEKNRREYLVVCTGHQGEPGSILDRITKHKLPYNFKNLDSVIFSSSVIPTKINIENREKLDLRLRKKGARIFNNIHVSGHGGREDIRDLIHLVNPEHIIPSHGGKDKTTPMISLGEEMGYKNHKNIHLLTNGDTINI